MEKLLKNFLYGEKITNDDSDEVLNFLFNSDIDDLINGICEKEFNIRTIEANNIPQFSNLRLVDNVVEIVGNANIHKESIYYQYVGERLVRPTTKGAQTKYGENHLKLAIEMGLITNKPYEVSALGRMYNSLNSEQKCEIRTKLFFRIPIIQLIIKMASFGPINVYECLIQYLSSKTAIRRKSSLRRIINEIDKFSNDLNSKNLKENIIWND